MTGHGSIVHYRGPDNKVVDLNSSSYESITCGHCGEKVVGCVVAALYTFAATQWIRCPSCGAGSVIHQNVQYPGPKTGGDVAALPEDVHRAYEEARACASVNAFTAAEVMCRKILMHVAVDKGAEENKSFAYYIQYLSENGYVTPPMTPWVDAIRKNGNVAVHDIPATDEERAIGTLIFTEQLLRLVYLMEHLAAKYAP
ncbi:DUF4145 domain-containing protein [Streptomyces nigra]|uniref:DUF4145 domain-containing protein n=1 Tax=Streptomyces nigra TaxID=1827580 RepID=UPI0037F13ADE